MTTSTYGWMLRILVISDLSFVLKWYVWTLAISSTKNVQPLNDMVRYFFVSCDAMFLAIFLANGLLTERISTPWFFVHCLYTTSYCLQVQFLRGQFLTKKLSVRGNFSNYFMKFIVFSQLYRSKSATLDIAYDMKIDSLLFIP